MNTIKSFLIPLLLVPSFVFAQSSTVLPNAGFTPESPFYFLDTLGETLREFFTFNPEGKARLQVTFAAERIAEIKVVLVTKGVNANGLAIAESRLQANLVKINAILADEKQSGKDVSVLAKELNDNFEGPRSALKEAYKAEKLLLKAKAKELETKIRDARKSGDMAQVESLLRELGEVKAQKEFLEQKEDEQEDAQEREVKKLEEEMDDKAESEKAIREAMNGKQEVLGMTASTSPEVFQKFDQFIVQAKELFEKGNYQGAKQLAEQAEKTLDKIEDAIDELEEATEKEERLKDEREEAVREEKEEQDESRRESMKKEIELLEQEQGKAEESRKSAEEQLRDIDDED